MTKLDRFFGKNFLFMLAMKFPKRRHTNHASNLYFVCQTEKKIELSDHISPILTNFAQTSSYVVNYNSHSMYSRGSKKFPNYVCKYIKFFVKVHEIRKFYQ